MNPDFIIVLFVCRFGKSRTIWTITRSKWRTSTTNDAFDDIESTRAACCVSIPTLMNKVVLAINDERWWGAIEIVAPEPGQNMTSSM